MNIAWTWQNSNLLCNISFCLGTCFVFKTCAKHPSSVAAGGHYVAAWGAGSSGELPMLMPRKLRSGHRLMMLSLGVACGALSHCIWQLVVFTFVFGLMGNGKRWNVGWRGCASRISYFSLGISFFFM